MSKYCIITGSNGAIGKELVSIFQKNAYNIFGIDLLNKNTSVKNVTYKDIDLFSYVDENDVRKALDDSIKEICKKNPTEIILINNAAIQQTANFKKLTLNELKTSIYVNSLAPLLISQTITNHYKKNVKIINIGSVHAKQTKKNFLAYAGSKSLLESFSRSMAIELSNKKTSVIHINPGAIKTPMLIDGFKDKTLVKNLEKLIPATYIPDASEFADFVFYISNLNSNYFSGTVIDYNGAITHTLSDPEN